MLRKRIICSIVSLIVGLAAIEFFLWSLMPVQLHEVTHLDYRVSENRYLVYEPMPLAGEFNSDGLRDHEYQPAKPRDVYRIVVIGDSLAFGLKVTLEETYAKRLEKKLNEREGVAKKYEVINLGVPGYRISQIVERFKEKGLKYNPDLVIYGYWLDDPVDNGVDVFFLSPTNRIVDKKIKSVENKNILQRRITQVLLRSQIVRRSIVVLKEKGYRDEKKLTPFFAEGHAKHLDPPIFKMYKQYLLNYERGVYKDLRCCESYYRYYVRYNDFVLFNNGLKELSEICRGRNIKCLLLMTPVLYDHREGEYNWEGLHRFVRDIVNYYLIPTVDLTEVFEKYRADEVGVGDNEHPNALGNKIVADQLFQFLVDHEKI